MATLMVVVVLLVVRYCGCVFGFVASASVGIVGRFAIASLSVLFFADPPHAHTGCVQGISVG